MPEHAETHAVHLDDVAAEMGADHVEGSSTSSQSELPPFATFNAVAAFTDAHAAREAILRLERAGIDGSKVSFVAFDESDQSIDQRSSEMDHEQVGFVARGTAKGGSLGTIGGAALGGGFFGGVIGGIWGGFNRMGASAAWDETFHDIENGMALVGMHTDDRKELDNALRSLDGERVRVFDRDGKAVELGDE
jgi:hypothetical protein